ncbi:hypothetical protein GQ53DRAFT_839988 [Thozetella sp. PMI_491]|nr:hypothetical protein GQ53DRAFT_839988 [Thozetella sp. PMI_491]
MDETPNTQAVCELIYRPLDKSNREIRLINILPSSDTESDVCCELFTTSLNSKPRYSALSYVWGYYGDTGTILLNGHEFSVTNNLLAALRTLRGAYHEVRVWADAVCINQMDKTERMHQVELMQDIYRSTRRAFVWLGDAEAQSLNQVPADCLTWSGSVSDNAKIALLLKQPRPGAEFMFGALSLLAQNDLHLSALGSEGASSLLESLHHLGIFPWWHRIWVVQETILPKEVTICLGRFRAPLWMVSRAVQSLAKHVSTCCSSHIVDARYVQGIDPEHRELSPSLGLLNQELAALAGIEDLFRSNHKLTLLSLLLRFCQRQASDPRDIIYGMLGLVTHWDGDEPITPDYSKPLEVLFREVSLRFIQSSFEALSFAGTVALRTDPSAYLMHQWSSWIVDWRTIHLNYGATKARDALGRYYLYSASSRVHEAPIPYGPVSGLPGRHALSFQGISVGKLEAIARVEFSASHQLDQIVRGMPDRLGLEGNKTVLEAVCRTICWDSIPNDIEGGLAERSKMRRIFPADLEAIRQRLGRDISWDDDVYEFLPPSRRASLKNQRTHLFRTDSNSLGCLESHSMFDVDQSGSLLNGSMNCEVFILLGSRVPLVLRPLGKFTSDRSGQKQYYQLVSQCYVHGLMDGEVFERQVAAETIEICLV